MSVGDARGAPVPPPPGFRVIAHDGEFADTSHWDAGVRRSVRLAYERPGLYRLEISAPGYLTIEVADVGVASTDDGCHVQTERLIVPLTRSR